MMMISLLQPSLPPPRGVALNVSEQVMYADSDEPVIAQGDELYGNEAQIKGVLAGDALQACVCSIQLQ